uniref:ARAD1C45496p n=1 Tax=Blastobotrys adeninivorans TaxID=409370 RepID=A0A060TAF6_BLAAD
MKLSISFKGQLRDLQVNDDLSLAELQSMIEEETRVPSTGQKLIAPKVGVIKADKYEQKEETPVCKIVPDGTRLMLVGTPAEQMAEFKDAEDVASQRAAKLAQRADYLRKHAKRATISRSTITQKQASTQYTFVRVEPLPFLPDPQSARALLERIRDDRGVQAIMERYKWRVGLLTELDPASNTTHESRLLGRNRNKGQVIELRLRTDDYGGFCSYKEIIKVLCHELAHNVHSEHDRQFWDLTNKLERQVLDWNPFGRSGKRIGHEVYDGPGLGLGDGSADQLHVDEGGWFGSSQVLGTASSSSPESSSSTSSSSSVPGESLRDKMRRAAESRKR